MTRAVILFALFVAPVVAKVSPVAKVMVMMNDLKAKSLQEKRAEAVAMTSFTGWCKSTDKSREKSIAAAKVRIEQLSADIEKYDTTASELADEVADLDAKNDAAEADKAAAEKSRKEDNDLYKVTHADLQASVSEITLGKKEVTTMMETTFIQTLMTTHKNLPMGAKSALAAFLHSVHKVHKAQETHEVSNLLETSAPEAKQFESKSGVVMAMMDSLEDKLKDELKQCEFEEMNKVGAHNMLVQSLVNQINANKDARGRRFESQKENEEASAEANSDLSQTKATKAEDEKYLADLRAECTQKTADFHARQKLRKEEIEAIDKAIEIINSPDVTGMAEKHLPTLTQTSSAFAQLRSAAANPAQLQAAAYLKTQGQKLGLQTLSALAIKVTADPFGKVIKMIKDMIQKLMEEANDEAQHKGWCDTELGTNKQTREQKSSEVDELTAAIEEMTAKSEKLAEEVERLTAEVAESDAAVMKATKIREEEKAKNTETVADAKIAVPAVEKALQVLKDFYAKASQATSLVETSAQSGPKDDAPETFSSEPYQGNQDSGGIIGMLEVIVSDFQRLIAETEEEEATGLREYEVFMAESAKDKAVKETNLKHKSKTITDLQVKSQEAKNDLSSANEELAAAMEYYSRLKPSCVDSGLSYEDRVKAREEEIQSLKEALQMLS